MKEPKDMSPDELMEAAGIWERVERDTAEYIYSLVSRGAASLKREKGVEEKKYEIDGRALQVMLDPYVREDRHPRWMFLLIEVLTAHECPLDEEGVPSDEDALNALMELNLLDQRAVHRAGYRLRISWPDPGSLLPEDFKLLSSIYEWLHNDNPSNFFLVEECQDWRESWDKRYPVKR